MTMNVATIVFGVLAVLFLGGVITVFALPKSVLRDESKWKTFQPENVVAICAVLFLSCAIIAACCWMNKCDNCNNFVNTAYCSHCGDINEEYAERVGEPDAYAKCPECEERWRTHYCGDCGKQLIGDE